MKGIDTHRCQANCNTWFVKRPTRLAESRSSKKPISWMQLQLTIANKNGWGYKNTCIRIFIIILRLIEANARLNPMKNTTVWTLDRTSWKASIYMDTRHLKAGRWASNIDGCSNECDAKKNVSRNQ
jgi:hypothetical protein